MRPRSGDSLIRDRASSNQALIRVLLASSPSPNKDETVDSESGSECGFDRDNTELARVWRVNPVDVTEGIARRSSVVLD